MLPSSRRQFIVMVNSNFASSSIRQPNIAWPRPSTGPQVFAGLVLTEIDNMAAIRMMFSWLTEKRILAINPAREVKTPKFSWTEGKTPAFSTEEVQKVLASIDTSHVVGHRDKAFLATLAYTFARIGAVVNLKVEDYFHTGKRSLIRFKEKGGKEKEIPVHHKSEEIMDEYLKVSKLREKPDTPLFPTTLGKSRELGARPMTRFDGANLYRLHASSPEAEVSTLDRI
jgi:site-specific recombinase XerC